MNHEDYRALLTADEQLDDETLALIETVMRRVRAGDSGRSIQEHLRYRRRIAQGEDKLRVRRVAKAMRTDRWGLADAVRHVRGEARRERRDARASAEARSIFHETVADATRLIPPNKRGRGSSSGGRRRKNKSVSRRQPPGTLV